MSSKFTIIVSTPSQDLVYKEVEKYTDNKKEGTLTFSRGNVGYVTTSRTFTIIEEKY